MPGKALQNELIRLRMAEPRDVDFLYELENDPEVWRAGNTLVPYSKFQIEQYVLNSQHDLYTEKQLRLMIDRLSSGESPVTVGAVDLFDFDPFHRRAGIGIIILPEERNRGIAGEALGLMQRYCFEILSLHQIHCSITIGNQASIRLFTGKGFKQTGVRRDWRYMDGRFVDELVFQLLSPFTIPS